MLLIQSDATRLIHIPGVPAPVRRPVDIDQTITGFNILRTLRIYCFDEGSVIEGHAEEDEVYLVVLTGSLELTISTEPAAASPKSATLFAPGTPRELACAAYLPTGSSYKLIARSETEVAYARATPRQIRSPRILPPPEYDPGSGLHLLLEDTIFAERLRFRLLRICATAAPLLFSPKASAGEQLIHVTNLVRQHSTVVSKAHNLTPLPITSGDTLVIEPGDQPIIKFAEDSRCLVLILTASDASAAGS